MPRRIIKKPSLSYTPEYLRFVHCANFLGDVNARNERETLQVLMDFDVQNYAPFLIKEILETDNLFLWGALFENPCLRENLSASTLLHICRTPKASVARLLILEDPKLYRQVHANHLVEVAINFKEPEFVAYLLTDKIIFSTLDKYGIGNLACAFPDLLDVLLGTMLDAHNILSPLRKPYWLPACFESLIACESFVDFICGKLEFISIFEKHNLDIEELIIAIISALPETNAKLWVIENCSLLEENIYNKFIEIVDHMYPDSICNSSAMDPKEEPALNSPNKSCKDFLIMFNKIASGLFTEGNCAKNTITHKPNY